MSNGWMHVLGMATLAITLGAPSVAASELDRVVDGYVQEALVSNLALRQRSLDVDRARAALAEARAAWKPQVQLAARYSRADGGRTIEIPIGDLLNPVYRTLNDQLVAQGRPPSFPTLENESIELLRSREQETRLSLSQVLYAPAIGAQVGARSALIDLEDAGREALARQLVRDVRRAYYDWRRAQEGIGIVRASRDLLQENLRVNSSLFDNGKVTRDQVLRAEAELLAIEQQEREAQNQIDLAASYFNFLRNAELDAPIIRVDDIQLPAEPVPALADVRKQAEQRRPEQRQSAAGERAAAFRVSAEKAAYRPTLGFGLDGGIQGENYRFGDDDRFAVASLSLQWTFGDGGARRARVAQAALAHEAATLKVEETADQIALDAQRARDSLATAHDSLKTAEARFEAARAGFAIASRKRDAGSISQVEFLDARSALTQAELNLSLTRFDWLARRADLDYATAAEPLNDLLNRGEHQ